MSWKAYKQQTSGTVDFHFDEIDKCLLELNGWVPLYIDAPVRFSSEKQADGSSAERQIKNISNICKRINPKILPRWISELTKDGKIKAQSGFKYNKKTGLPACLDETKALGAYVKNAENGGVPAGTLVVVDDLDRWARARLYHSETSILTLALNGIHLLVLHPTPFYMAPQDIDNPEKRAYLIREIARAYTYSKALQVKVKTSYTTRIEYVLKTGKQVPFGGIAPNWLDWDAVNEIYIPNIAIWAVVERIIREVLANKPFSSIIQDLNVEGAVRLSHAPRWTDASLRKLLVNPALVGRLRLSVPMLKENGEVQRDDNGNEVRVPTIIKNDYYKPMVAQDVWDILQARMAVKLPPGGARKDRCVRNLFPAIVFCVHCGRPMLQTTNQGASPGYACRGYYEHSSAEGMPVCTQTRQVPRIIIEEDFFAFLLKQLPSEILSPPDGIASQAKIAKLQVAIAKAIKDAADYKDTFWNPDADAEQKQRFKSEHQAFQTVERDLKQELSQLMKATQVDPGAAAAFINTVNLLTKQAVAEITPESLALFALDVEKLKAQLLDNAIRRQLVNSLRMLISRVEIDVEKSHSQAASYGGELLARYRVQFAGRSWSEWRDVTTLYRESSRVAAKHSALVNGLKAAWSNPEKRQRTIANQKKAAVARWANPEYRAKMMAARARRKYIANGAERRAAKVVQAA